ncbi:MAG TPA: PEGA domain-containing protein [Myxococcota bacterium]|nr:PEGA domain-containing protein [Myxococcota bacterium]
MRRLVLLAVIGLPVWPSVAQGQNLPLVAVFDMEDRGSGLDPKTRQNLTEFLSASLAECGFGLVPRDKIKERLVQQKKDSYKPCFEQSCQVELGKELAAQKTLSSQILKIGDTCQVTATLYDLKKAATEGAATGDSTCKEESLLAAIRTIAAKLCQPAKAREAGSTQAVLEFEELLKDTRNAKELQEEIRSNWSYLYSLAKDESVQLETRVRLLHHFLSAYAGDNPYEAEGQRLLREIVPGRLTVTTEPAGASVLISGYNKLGPSPILVALREGTYKVTAELEGFAANQYQVTVESNKDTTLKITLRNTQPGVLWVTSEPRGANVSLENSEGQTLAEAEAPFAANNLEAGSYFAVIEMEGYLPERREFVIANGMRTELKVALRTIPPASLVVETDPPGALVAIGQEPGASAPLRRDLPAGKYRIEATLEGHVGVVQEVDLQAGQEAVVALSLARIYPMNPMARWAHGLFWSGVGLSVLGAAATGLTYTYGDDDKAGDPDAAGKSRTWAGVMYASFGTGFALLVAGAVLWFMAPEDREWFKDHPEALSIVPTDGGATFSFGGRW